MTPSGRFITSKNTNASSQARGLLNLGLRRWKSFKSEEPKAAPRRKDASITSEMPLPKDGIILREVMRDLPRAVADRDAWRHNLDHFWLSRADCLSLIPEEKKKGAIREIEGTFKRRLLLFHLVDQVRGESSPWTESNVRSGRIGTRIIEIDEDFIKLSLTGIAKMVQEPNGEKNPFTGKRVTKERGIDLKISGAMIFNRKSETFERFDMVGVGDRWGTDVYSFRHTDPGPHPIGFGFELLPPKSRNRPVPAYAWWGDYFESP